MLITGLTGTFDRTGTDYSRRTADEIAPATTWLTGPGRSGTDPSPGQASDLDRRTPRQATCRGDGRCRAREQRNRNHPNGVAIAACARRQADGAGGRDHRRNLFWSVPHCWSAPDSRWLSSSPQAVGDHRTGIDLRGAMGRRARCPDRAAGSDLARGNAPVRHDRPSAGERNGAGGPRQRQLGSSSGHRTDHAAVTGKVAPRFCQSGADSHSRRRHRSSRPAHDVRWSRSAAAAESGPQRHSRMATMLQRRAVDGRRQIVVSTLHVG